jgi:acyl carrier protein
MDETIRSILAEHVRFFVDIENIGDHDDLYQMGMTSHATVNVMLALEDEFDVEFSESMLSKSTFESVSAIRLALNEMTGS